MPSTVVSTVPPEKLTLGSKEVVCSGHTKSPPQQHSKGMVLPGYTYHLPPSNDIKRDPWTCLLIELLICNLESQIEAAEAHLRHSLQIPSRTLLHPPEPKVHIAANSVTSPIPGGGSGRNKWSSKRIKCKGWMLVKHQPKNVVGEVSNMLFKQSLKFVLHHEVSNKLLLLCHMDTFGRSLTFATTSFFD